MINRKAAKAQTSKLKSSARQAVPQSGHSAEWDREAPTEQILAKPTALLRPKDTGRLQRALGNRAVTRLLASNSGHIQRQSLSVRLAQDHFEQEADKVAKMVTEATGESLKEPGALNDRPAASINQHTSVNPIQRALGKTWRGQYVIHTPSKQRFFAQGAWPDRTPGKVKHELEDHETGESIYVQEDDPDYEWELKESNKADTGLGKSQPLASASSSSSDFESEDKTESIEQPPASAKGPAPMERRPIIKLYMQQGVAAPLGQVILHSGQFSSCSPVVMLNYTTGRGGLFHFAAGELESQAGHLLELCDQVAPEVIYLMQGREPSTTFNDQTTLRGFFEENRPGIEVKHGASFSGLYLTLDKNQIPDWFQMDELGRVPTHDLRKRHTVQLPADCHFVGAPEAADYWE